jgi:hypothetical protein
VLALAQPFAGELAEARRRAGSGNGVDAARPGGFVAKRGPFRAIVEKRGEETMRHDLIAAAGMAAMLFASPAFAHHSFAIFDQTKLEFKIGTLKQLEFVNPHAWVHMLVEDPAGKAVEWSFEAGSPLQLTRLGWKPADFRAGDKITMGYRPMKDGSRGGQVMSVMLANGRKVCSNRGCENGPQP